MIVKYIKNLIGGKSQPSESPPQSKSGTLPKKAGRIVDTGHIPSDDVVTDILPVETSGESSNSESLRQRFLGRQLLLDRAQQVAGYELMLRHERLPQDSSDLQSVQAQTLVKCLIELDIGRLVGGKLALLTLPPSMLDNPLLLSLPHKGMTLCVDFSSRHDDNLAAQCRKLKALGYQFALDNLTPDSNIDSLLGIVQFARIDVTRYNAIDLARLVDKLLEKAPNIHLIGYHVNSETEFEACHHLFFHYFQGSYFAKRQTAAPARVDNDRIRVIELLNMVKNRADITELEAVFKHDAMLSYKLLLYMNAPVNGLSQEIRSIAHAIIILGYEQLYRWLTLLLFTSGKVDPRSKALLKSALVRARMAEILGQDKFKGPEKDELFIVGVFSLLDVLLNMPMEQALERLNLPASITQALTHHDGVYAPYLDLTLACEEADEASIARIAEKCGLDAMTVNQAHIQALVWTEDIDL